MAFDSYAKHKDLCRALSELYARKNADYGSSFAESFEKWGMVSPLIRIGDKYNRLVSLAKNPQQVNDESVRDTLIDLANYALMTIIELDRQKEAAYDQERH